VLRHALFCTVLSAISVDTGYISSHVDDLGRQSDFCSGNPLNQRLCDNFENRRVHLKSYSRLSLFDTVPSLINLLNWVLEETLDRISSIELDHRIDDLRLNRGDAVATYEVEKEEPSRMI
jgi:hypothetical protein